MLCHIVLEKLSNFLGLLLYVVRPIQFTPAGRHWNDMQVNSTKSAYVNNTSSFITK